MPDERVAKYNSGDAKIDGLVRAFMIGLLSTTMHDVLG
jgi:hypothetical protein